MPRSRLLATAAVTVALATVLGACGDDDGSGVRDGAEACGSASASGGSASASGGSASAGSGSCPSRQQRHGSGIGDQVEGSTTDNPLVEDALVEYKAYVDEQVDETIAATTTFTDAVRAGDLEAAKEAYAPSRQGWERIEPIASLVEEIDGAVDARVDDFEGVDDPAFTGLAPHRVHPLGAGHDRRRRRVRRRPRREPADAQDRDRPTWRSRPRRWRSARPS